MGLVCGLAESLMRLGWRYLGPRVSAPDLWVNWNSPWMAPPAMACWCFGFGVAASVAHRVLPRSTGFLVPRLLIALGAWSALTAIPGLAPWAVAILVAGIVVRLGGFARFDSPKYRRFARRSLPYALGLWAVLAIATGIVPAWTEAIHRASAPRPPAGAPNVILIVLDTVRADNLGLYGYDRPTTPNLEAFARRGVRFNQARATAPYTLGTHASLFTGYWMSRTSVRVDAPLDGSRTTLAEHLRDRGYATAGFVGNIFYGSAHYGLDRGFVRYHDVPGNITRRVTPREFARSCGLGEAIVTYLERKWRILAPMQRQRLDAGQVNREALAWLDGSARGDRPFFLFLNYFDAHSPYALPPETPRMFAHRSPEGVEVAMKRVRELEGDGTHGSPEIASLRAEVHSDLRDLYDDGISWIDRKLGELFDDLEKRGLVENTLVVLTADHGEMLGEHGLIGHGDSLTRPVVHVPLIVVGGRGMPVPRGAAVDRPVSLRSVPATVLDLMGDPSPDAFPGPSLRTVWEGRGDAGPIVSEMDHMHWLPRSSRMPVAYGPMKLLTEGRWSYHRQDHESLGLQEHLFDLEVDPGECHDLAADSTHRATLEALRRRLDAAFAPGLGSR